MSQPYVGEIRMFGGSFKPAGWAFCNGQPLPISENDVLFQLIGTTYGGDGQETFNLPNLSGRIPLHQGTNPSTGTNYIPGQTGGVETVTLTTQQIPVHNHAVVVSKDQGTQSNPSGNTSAANTSVLIYRPGAGTQTFDPSTLAPAGGNQPHENMQPYLAVTFIISLFGIYPSPN
jgi:microcystin-dependent protein